MIPKSRYFGFYYVAFIAAAGVLLTLVVLSYLRIEQQRKASGWVSHTFLVKIKLETLLTVVNEAESNQRAFLLTKDSAYHQNFKKTKSDLADVMSDLDTLTKDNPTQFENLQKLNDLVKNRFIRLQTLMDSSRHLSDDILSQFLLPGRKIMDSIRTRLLKMEAEENNLLNTRTAAKNEADRNVGVLILLFSVISLVVLLFSVWRVRAENAKRAKAEIDVDVLETKVSERTKEIQQINKLLTEQNLALERKNAELASFTFMASHDLKEPLRKIETFTDRIIQTETSGFSNRSKEYFDRIIVSVKRMQGLIDSVFMYAETNITHADFIPVDLNTILATTIDNLHEQITEKKAVIEHKPLPVVSALPEQMEQLFTNLIGNAIKYAKTGVAPRITISSRLLAANDPANKLKEEAWEIEFADNGIGFDEKYIGKIFQIFQRLHNKEEYSGTGIGLAICKKIAENHHGVILAKSSPGNGAIFSVVFPSNIVSGNY
jgi:signal transduction histidine kinase